MAADYKTPGVYVEEISKFPPSIAQVETAIPAFIGYTEKAEKLGEQLSNKPTLVRSIAEYEQFFGKDAPQRLTVTVDSSNNVTAVTPTGGAARYYLYDCLRLYFDNGGGRCYIVSVGNYATTIGLVALKAALSETAKVDEPTILCSPDAVSLPGNELYEFQKTAIAQCAALQDRVTICDLLQANQQVANQTFDDRVNQFRSGIGTSELKYAAAYAPWLQTTLPRVIRFRDLTFTAGFSLKAATSDLGIVKLIDTLQAAITLYDQLNPVLTSGLVNATPDTLEGEIKALFDAYAIISSTASVANNTLRATALGNIVAHFALVVKFLNDQKSGALTNQGLFPDFKLSDDLISWGGSTGNTTYRDMVEQLIFNVNGAQTAIGAAALNVFPAAVATPYTEMLTFFQPYAPFADLNTSSPSVDLYYTTIKNDFVGSAQEKNKAVQDALRDYLRNASNGFVNLINKLLKTVKEYENTFDDALSARFGFYKSMLSSIIRFWNVLPPSAAIAGIYARVDNARGVWKAPANESLSSVIGPDVLISHADQASLNVDVNAGKSINAIRSFTGKGTLVWGARTLAGNDNEWRYVSVRRFFNMVEESTKKASEQFVFEANDANTWVKIQAMIENFLNSLWRVGALQGVIPEHAFYVKVGLGTTMTPLDILEGRMIIEIGMAVVRPAEFIILRFSHKMAES